MSSPALFDEVCQYVRQYFALDLRQPSWNGTSGR